MSRTASRPEPLDALVVDADLRQSLVTIRSLGRAGIRVGAFDSSPRTPGSRSRWRTASGVLPPLEREPDAWVDAVVSRARDHGARVVFCSHDGGIEALRARRSAVEDVARLALAPEPALAVAVSKEATIERAQALGIPAPRGLVARSEPDLDGAVAEIGLPLVVKPSQSWNQSGVAVRLASVVATTADEVRASAARVWAAGGTPIVQEWVGGEREAVSIVRTGETRWATFAQVATRMHPPLGGSSVVRASIEPPTDVLDAADRLTRDIGLDGYSEVEFRRDASGRALLMEINPRLSASVEIAVHAGVDFPMLVYAWAAGLPLWHVEGYRTGIGMRWLGGDIRWLASTFASQGEPDSPPRRRASWIFVRDFARPYRYDYVAIDDPLPAVQATATNWRRAVRRTAYRGAALILRAARRAGLR